MCWTWSTGLDKDRWVLRMKFWDMPKFWLSPGVSAPTPVALSLKISVTLANEKDTWTLHYSGALWWGHEYAWGYISVSTSRTTQHSVILPTSKAECVAMVHGTKTALAIRAVLDLFSHILVASRLTCMRITRGQRRWLNTPRAFTAASTLTYVYIFCGGLWNWDK